MHRRARKGEREAMAILPEEVWAIVLDFLKNGRDLQNASTTCQVWKKCLEKYQATWKIYSIFPSLYPFLPKSAILAARLVCSNWNKTVDKYLQTRQAFLWRSTVLGHPTNWLRLLTADFPQTREKLSIERNIYGIGEDNQVLEIFQQQFGQSKNNPFPTRSVHIHLTEIASGPPLFFQTFGRHIWYLSLKVDQSEVGHVFGRKEMVTTPEKIAKFLWAVFSKTPNLQSLKINLASDSRYFKQPELKKQTQQRDLETFLNKKHLPSLPKLKNLELSLCMQFEQIQKNLQEAFAKQLTAYSQIDTTHKWRCAKLFATSLENLEHLSWQFGYPPCFQSQIANLTGLTCSNLETLTFEIRQNEARVNRCPSLLFGIAEKFGSSLKHLSVYWEYLEYDFPLNLDLPVLQSLYIEINKIVFKNELSWGFLKKLQSLKKFKLCFSRRTYCKIVENQQNMDKVNEVFGDEFCHRDGPTDEKAISVGRYLESYDNFCQPNAVPVASVYKCIIWNMLPVLGLIEVGIVTRNEETFRRGADANILYGRLKNYTRQNFERSRAVEKRRACTSTSEINSKI